MSNQRNCDRATSEIRVEYRTVGSFLSDYALNLSKGGMFIHSEHPLPVGATVRLVFLLPGLPFMFDLSGRVRWVQAEALDAEHPCGMGIEFIQVDERVRKRLETHVQRLKDEVPESLREPTARPRVEVLRPGSGSGSRQQETKVGEPPPPSGGRKP
ncbi:MAG TPA: TIGR02266 family protein [Myxococcota bacterium]|nr:TIGR02266 family protein [Myxococcota bacterium]HRY93994.1 TIGR02266 family protein [Myxococcota bacterium]HSA23537.1 TIGR02266 family protein [Myxococcota bacterium]